MFLRKAFLYFGKGILRTLTYLELEAYSEPETLSEHCQNLQRNILQKNSDLALILVQARKIKKCTPKKFLIFQKMKLSGSNIKKILIFSYTSGNGKHFLYFRKRKNRKSFLYFLEINLFLYFGKRKL